MLLAKNTNLSKFSTLRCEWVGLTTQPALLKILSQTTLVVLHFLIIGIPHQTSTWVDEAKEAAIFTWQAMTCGLKWSADAQRWYVRLLLSTTFTRLQ